MWEKMQETKFEENIPSFFRKLQNRYEVWHIPNEINFSFPLQSGRFSVEEGLIHLLHGVKYSAGVRHDIKHIYSYYVECVKNILNFYLTLGFPPILQVGTRFNELYFHFGTMREQEWNCTWQNSVWGQNR